MNKFIGFVFLILISGGFGTVPMKEYCNDRFSFCISYPEGFTGEGEAGNGDGQIFMSKDKEAEIRAYGELVLEEVNDNFSEVYASAAKRMEVSYKVVKQDWFVISGLDKNGKIVYRKTVKRKVRYMGSETEDTFVYQTLMITYPKAKQNLYGSYCGVISKSF